jgi:hypothetical protein
VATVTSDGLITAVTSGAVLISILNEGALAVLSVQVSLGGDSDGDRVPDDLELTAGLNPNDPVDALEDQDFDDVSNADEILTFGTRIDLADTDGDGVVDGEEVALRDDGFVTNPLLPDTDGDGVRDGLELTAGSDPTDASSVVLDGIVTALEVTPSFFSIVVNALSGEAFEDLSVTGRLVDGSSIDLTSTARGTRYTSSDLSICSFGIEPGRIFGGADGACVITISSAGLTASATGEVESFAPIARGFVALPGTANAVDVQRPFAYVAAGSAGVQVVSASDPAAPVIVGSAPTVGNANDLTIVGDRLYVAQGSGGLVIFDLTDPSAPVRIGSIDTPGDAQGVAVSGDVAIVADGSSGLQAVSVIDPANPTIVGSLSLSGTALGVAVAADGEIAAIARGSAGVSTIDVRDPAAPLLLGTASGGNARDVVFKEPFVLVADQSRSLTAIDLTNPAAPVVRASTPDTVGGRLNDVALRGDLAFGADTIFFNAVPIVNVRTPEAPTGAGAIDFSAFRDDNGAGIAVDSNFVYLAANTSTARLYIGQYLALEDTAGIAPTVAIVSPADGSEFIEGQEITVRADAFDDVAVAAVEFRIDGVTVSSDSTAPFEAMVEIPLDRVSVLVEARAVDLGGNVGMSAPIEIVVLPDVGTAITGVVIGPDGFPFAGAAVDTTGGRTAVTASDGSFVIADAPTVRGPLRVRAQAIVEGVLLTGRSAPVEPIPGGVADVGTIRIAPIPEPTATFTGAGGSASWSNPANWDIERVPTGGDDVLIPEGSAVALTGTAAVRSVHLLGSLTVTQARVTLGEEASLTRAAFLEPGSSLRLTDDAQLTIQGGMLVDGTITLADPSNQTGSANAAVLGFLGDQVVDGTGSIVFGQSNTTEENRVEPVGPGTTTFEGVTIGAVSGGDGQLGGSAGTFAFGGTIAPDPSTAISRIEIVGPIDSAGATMTVLEGPGQFVFENGGALRNAIVVGSGTLHANGQAGGAGATFSNVRLDANLRFGDDARITVSDGMTLNGTITLADPSNQTGSANAAVLGFLGDQVVDGSGSIVFGVSNSPEENRVEPVDGSTVTFRPGTTIDGRPGRGTLGGDGVTIVQGTFFQGGIVFGGSILLP